MISSFIIGFFGALARAQFLRFGRIGFVGFNVVVLWFFFELGALTMIFVSLLNYGLVRSGRVGISIAVSLTPLLFLKMLTAGTGTSSFWLPFALSFFCLQQIGAVVDCGRSEGETRKIHLLDWLSFSLFAPCMLAGPILRLFDFLKILRETDEGEFHLHLGWDSFGYLLQA
ncbi:MAG: hypothetical protein RBT63_04870, partial [Bdellovibrionales bacterium]|nr:hypothetical protein [Bdellovibrionales bacterium]